MPTITHYSEITRSTWEIELNHDREIKKAWLNEKKIKLTPYRDFVIGRFLERFYGQDIDEAIYFSKYPQDAY